MTDEVKQDKLLDELADLCIDLFLKQMHKSGSMKLNSSISSGGSFNGRLGHLATAKMSSTGVAI